VARTPVVTLLTANAPYKPFALPVSVGTPPPDRYASTPVDNLCELAGRVCYDSHCAQHARPSPEYHENIYRTDHLSVYAHAVFAFEAAPPAPADELTLHRALAARPGVWVTRVSPVTVRFAASLRALIEWPRHGLPLCGPDRAAVAGQADFAAALGRGCLSAAARVGPLATREAVAGGDGGPGVAWVRPIVPFGPLETWASVYLEGVSRDLLQELVRHHWQANPSVRSTRYVDEAESTYVPHPALSGRPAESRAHLSAAYARQTYKAVFDELTAGGVDKKTARGAARSVLPGGTETRLVFTASAFQWGHIFKQRLGQVTGAADPEIVRLAALLRAVVSPAFARVPGWSPPPAA
jgi:thymidylate synthase ThyX